MNPRILNVIYRSGIGVNAGGDWNLIHSRTLAFRELGCDVRSLCALPAGTSVPSRLAHVSYPFDFIHVPPAPACVGPFRFQLSALLTAKAIASVVNDISPDVLIISGNIIVPFLLKRTGKGIRTLIDIHGSLYEPRDYAPRTIKTLLRFCRDWYIAKRWYRQAFGAITVTQDLARECQKLAGVMRTFVVPCASTYRTTWGPVRAARVDSRRRLGIPCDHIVFAHAGGLGLYQKTELMAGFFARARQSGLRCTLLLLTSAPKAKERLAAQLPEDLAADVRCSFSEGTAYYDALAAADVGLVLREDNVTNRCAFPNKIDEFWAVGVPVLTTPGLRAVAEIISRHPECGLVVSQNLVALGDAEFGRVASLVPRDESAAHMNFLAIQRAREEISFSKTLLSLLTECGMHPERSSDVVSSHTGLNIIDTLRRPRPNG